MGLLKTKFISDDAITGAKIKLGNNENLRARNANDTADVNILKVNDSNAIEFASIPQVNSNPINDNDLARKAYVDTKIAASEKGAANGVATLDNGGKVPVSQLPNSIMEYKGTWSAATNTPTLADGTGDAGDVYINTAAGTVNFGSGNITFEVGDWAIYNGTTWQKSINSNAVVSVFGRTGAVTAQSGDYTWAQIDKTTSSLADITTRSHNDLTDKGSNTHAQIDSHISSTAIHFEMLNENDFASNSSTKTATQSSIKAYIDSVVSGTGINNKETFTLTSTDISNGYIVLAQSPKANSVNLIVQGAGAMVQGLDYTVTGAQVAWIGELASVISAGDKINVQYEY